MTPEGYTTRLIIQAQDDPYFRQAVIETAAWIAEDEGHPTCAKSLRRFVLQPMIRQRRTLKARTPRST